ncbi:MAG: hypothetical protein Q9M91_05685 [Candidatus Dojkabacteria bacterium]|nr:hypothetical protein [Candidatus Dojkabacteria bacterium]MDQ7021293.1 hypothetical protein [Candidatus Dojkabacteria bacterium]
MSHVVLGWRRQRGCRDPYYGHNERAISRGKISLLSLKRGYKLRDDQIEELVTAATHSDEIRSSLGINFDTEITTSLIVEVTNRFASAETENEINENGEP